MKVVVYFTFLLFVIVAAGGQPPSASIVVPHNKRTNDQTVNAFKNHKRNNHQSSKSGSSMRSPKTDTEIESHNEELSPKEWLVDETETHVLSNVTVSRLSLVSKMATKPSNGSVKTNPGNKMAAEPYNTSGNTKPGNKITAEPTNTSGNMKPGSKMAIGRGECASPSRRQAKKQHLSKKVQSRIVGGVDAEHGEFPYQVSIQLVEFIEYEHICGGATVSEKYVITSANCVTSRSLSSLLVVAGEYSLSSSAGFEQERDVVNIIVHPEYEYLSSPVNDIAVLELSSKLIYGFNVASIALALEVAAPDSPCIVTGWGTTSVGGQYADTLQKLHVTIMDDIECTDMYSAGEIVTERMVCAVDYTTNGDFCQGDEGGPLECGGYLHGLASWGTGCDSRCPGVYTQVIHYSDWIMDVIGLAEG